MQLGAFVVNQHFVVNHYFVVSHHLVVSHYLVDWDLGNEALGMSIYVYKYIFRYYIVVIYGISQLLCVRNPAFAGMGLMDMGTDTGTGTEWAIGICTRDTHIRQPARYTIPVLNTKCHSPKWLEFNFNTTNCMT